jgi:hypothetical protein
LRGEAAGRYTRGEAPDTLLEGGKVMTRERATEAFRDTVLLQGRDALAKDDVVGREVQEPAVVAVVPFEDQQRQDRQPTVCTAEEEQQQPPRHRFDAQSKLEAQDSPGEYVRQEPEPGAQPVQPARRAVEEQQ